jgi:hypothetical protein
MRSWFVIASMAATLASDAATLDSDSGYYTCAYCSRVKTDEDSDGELQQHENCAVVDSNGDIVVVEEHLRNIDFGDDSIAGVYIAPLGHAYVSRQGKVAMVCTYDNGPDYFAEGLARIVVDGKYGFIDRSLDVVIPPQYDMAYPFRNGMARVGHGCREDTVGEHRAMECGIWEYVDHHGRRVPEPGPEQPDTLGGPVGQDNGQDGDAGDRH